MFVPAAPRVVFGLLWATLVLLAYLFGDLEFLRVPFLPIGTIGTAVAFYIGFKNNSAYDRYWEGRKIWGGIVNASRSFANAVLTYVYAEPDETKTLVYRHLAWVNALRLQLRKKSRFHAWRARARDRLKWIREVESALRSDWDQEVGQYLGEQDKKEADAAANPATRILRQQGAHLRRLFDAKQLDRFHQVELLRLIEELYALQGKSERIKNTPLPRQYAFFGRLFTNVFVALVPLGLIDVFLDHGDAHAYDAVMWARAIAMVWSSAAITWVFMTMELVGDYSEDPFEGSFHDVPMTALSRTIEIDLRQLLGETDVPPPDQPLHDVLY